MRPTLLDPLFASVASLSGVGPKLAQLLASLLGREDAEDARVVDLLFLAPFRLIDRRNQPGIALAQQGAIVTITGRVDRHQPPPPASPACPTASSCTTRPEAGAHLSASGQLAGKGPARRRDDHRLRARSTGSTVAFHGASGPDGEGERAENMPLVEPVYPLTAGLSPKVLRKRIEHAVERVPELPEWADPALVTRQGFRASARVSIDLHHPRDERMSIRRPRRGAGSPMTNSSPASVASPGAAEAAQVPGTPVRATGDFGQDPRRPAFSPTGARRWRSPTS
jgi:ATP-dependent DNA helicase RecG